MQLRFRKMLKVQKIVLHVNVVSQASGLLSSGIKSVLDVGNTVCIQMPKRAIVLCFTIQKEIFMLPFRCLNKGYEAIKPPFRLVHRIYKALIREDPSPAELLTGEKNPSATKIIASSRQLRCSVMKAINKENNYRSRLSSYQRQLEKWKLENEKRTEEIHKITLEEKELMKAVASALRYIKSLKVKREKLNDCFSKNVTNMINSGDISEEKLHVMQKELKNIDAIINDKKNVCLNLLAQGRAPSDDFLGGLTPSKVQKRTSVKFDVSHIPVQTEPVQKVLSLLMDENMYLKTRLSTTHDKLEDILKLSESINREVVVLSEKFTQMAAVNNEMTDLQQKLDREREMLKDVEADRDQMRYKLETLASIIREEEEFLASTESSVEDGSFVSFAEDLDEVSTV
ncbi:hypothetical protein HNY73_010374 [Argiope bruennichi]|uniref:Uncharacterized protein n=2 Tax=Argiope bruennichi TaxID=94029 RepID=A0A8T0F5P1_ARGBR|nr:hypothetical protein HNY73_010374 [Argiope bruennichi]